MKAFGLIVVIRTKNQLIWMLLRISIVLIKVRDVYEQFEGLFMVIVMGGIFR